MGLITHLRIVSVFFLFALLPLLFLLLVGVAIQIPAVEKKLSSVIQPTNTHGEISLAGRWLFRQGDNPAWKSVGLDDREWQQIDVPRALHIQNLLVNEPIGWYRYHFDAVPLFSGALALMLGPIMEPDEVFINGAFIGGEGKLSSLTSATINPNEKSRVYLLPENLLNKNTANLLAVRVGNYGGWGGIARGPVMLGDYAKLSRIADQQNRQTIAVETVFGVILGGLVIGWLVLKMVLPQAGKELSSLGFLALLIFITMETDSLWLYLTGLKPQGMVLLAYFSFALLELPLIQYGREVFQLGHRRFWNTMEVLTVLSACLGLVSFHFQWWSWITFFTFYLLSAIIGVPLSLCLQNQTRHQGAHKVDQ